MISQKAVGLQKTTMIMMSPINMSTLMLTGQHVQHVVSQVQAFMILSKLLKIVSILTTQHVLSPTRGDAILDLVLSRDPDLVSDISIIHHNILSFVAHVHGTWTTAAAKYEILNAEIMTISQLLWVRLIGIVLGTANVCWDRFKDLLLKLIDEYIPFKNINRVSSKFIGS